MNQLTKKSDPMPMNFRMKKALGTFMLVSLAIGQPAIAQTAPETLFTTEVSAVVSEQSEPVAPVTPPTVQEVLLDVCKANGYGQECAQTLLGMLWTESSNRSTVIGDNGRARGYFQIHYKLHKISVACAEDLVCSANWSIRYLESNSYPKYPTYAVQCHNSCNVSNGYAAKVARHGKRFWNQPLAIKQAAPIELAMN